MAPSCIRRVAFVVTVLFFAATTEGRLADRARVVKARQEAGKVDRFQDNGRPLEGPSYRSRREDFEKEASSVIQERQRKEKQKQQKQQQQPPKETINTASKKEKVSSWTSSSSSSSSSGLPRKQQKPSWRMDVPELSVDPLNSDRNTGNDKTSRGLRHGTDHNEKDSEGSDRVLSAQLSGCCYDYEGTSAEDMCAMYGQDCESGETPSHDSGDDDCSQDGLSFIGISFSVNTRYGNPYSYQLCDQFPMENIIDRDYNYIMSMDEDGWLVGGGYKSFDYSGKMPYIDSSHTELLRIGNMNPDAGGTSISQVYEAMDSLSFPPFRVYPEYLKGGGGHHSGDNENEGGKVPSSDVTLIVSIVETYEDDDSYSAYEKFLENLFDAMDAVGGGPCMDDHDTDPHVSMARGVKFWSSEHMEEYGYNANLEVAVWQAMYPDGVVIGSNGYAAFPPDRRGTRQYVGYGNLYFFFDRANITKAFAPSRQLSDDEEYYSTLYVSTDTSSFYSDTTEIGFDYSGSQDNGGDEWKHNPYNWRANMAVHDFTDGWDLPPNCLQEGETFFGIPLARKSDSKLTKSQSFQEQFDFEMLVDRNNTYISSFGTNHGWLIGEELDNAVGSIVDKDTAHIPIFYMGNTNTNMGGMDLSDMIKIGREIDFGTLYIKPAFVFVDENGHVKLQFEADSNSALAYLYDNLCKMVGISWGGNDPYNNLGVYTNCAMHSAGDRAAYGCGPDNANSGAFCPQMTIAYQPRFMSEDYAAAYLARCNNYVDYWRSLYPNGVAVGTSDFCPDGGCLGLFLNRYDLYEVFRPDLAGDWVIWNGGTKAPTFSPAPTFEGGCKDPRNALLDRCFEGVRHRPRVAAAALNGLGNVARFSLILMAFMAVTLAVSMTVARARRKKRRGETYLQFLWRDWTKKKRKKKRRNGRSELAQGMLDGQSTRSKSRSRRSRSKSKPRSSGGSVRSSRSRSSRARSASRKRRQQEAASAANKVMDASNGGGDNRQQLV